MARTYSTLSEAVTREIVEPIEAGDVQDAYAAYDIDTIADKVLCGYEDGYMLKVEEPDFWRIVEENAGTAIIGGVGHTKQHKPKTNAAADNVQRQHKKSDKK